ncbi:MAG: type IV pilus secretin PilQ [Gammaproteobacteria bacterium]|nr:type IV pilus secretin PilQ [Gammaproteobacteria bacterium]
MITNISSRQLTHCTKIFIRTGLMLAFGVLCTIHSVQLCAQTVNSLEDISFNTLPGNRLQIALRMAEPATKPLSFTVNDPARISLDLLDTKNNLSQKTLPIGLGLARSITTAEAKGRTRVVLNLAQLVPYSTEVDDKTIYLTLENEAGLTQTSEPSTSAAAITNAAIRSVPELDRGISGIDFRRGSKGEARIIVNLSENNIPVDVNEEGGRIIVDFVRTNLPTTLARRLDVLDFATPAKTVDAFQNGNNVRIRVTPIDSNFEHLAYQSDDVFTLELKPIPKEVREQKIKEKFGYTGERLSLNFQDIEVRSVLQLIADFTNLNVVVSDTVSGKLTLRLKNVPWDQALDIILNAKGLAQRKSGNVLLIAPTEEIATREKLELEALAQVQELAPLRSEYMQVNYAKAEELALLLTGKDKKGGLLSERGRVSIDQRTNTLLIQDTSEKLEEMRGLISRLDIPIRQVLIESRIVIATDDFNKELGVRFGSIRNTTDDGDGSVVTGNLNAVRTTVNGEDIPLTDTLNVNLPASGSMGTLSLALARLPFGTLLALELSAMQAEGRGEVISTPRVITANQKEAFIEQGVEIPYQQSSSSGATNVAFKKAVLSLRVTPQITPDDRVIMDLVVNNDTVGELFGLAQIPSIDTREVQTQVLVNNGETIVLGGVFEQIKRDQVDKIPFFGSLPGIGGLFRRTTKQDDKSELLIFVTPKIIRDSVALN